MSPGARRLLMAEIAASEQEIKGIDESIVGFTNKREWLVRKIEVLRAELNSAGSIPPMQILGTKDDAMAKFREKHPQEVVREQGTRRPDGSVVRLDYDVIVEIPPSKETFVPSKPGPRQKIDEEQKAQIRQRYKNAKQGMTKAPRGWAKHVAKEYNVSESLIWNIVYTAEDYVTVPRA